MCITEMQSGFRLEMGMNKALQYCQQLGKFNGGIMHAKMNLVNFVFKKSYMPILFLEILNEIMVKSKKTIQMFIKMIGKDE